MSADDDKVDPIGSTLSSPVPENLRKPARREVDPMATTLPQGIATSSASTDQAREDQDAKKTARLRAQPSHARVTAPMRAQTPQPVPERPVRPRSLSRADTADPVDQSVNPMAVTVARMPSPLARKVSYPPSTWDRQNEVITSAQREHTKQPGENFAGEGIEAGNLRLTEARAREILMTRFADAGIALESDYPFRHQDLLVTLDGYDPARRVGYAFLSHSDADVVTDFDEATEMAFQELAGQGVAWVLVLHDADVPASPDLEQRIAEFLSRLPK